MLTYASVVGAGLVGSAAVLALSQLPDVEITGFEKSPVAREAGAWISLTVTGLKVLTKLIPPSEINAIVYRPPDRAVYVTRHWRTGNVLLSRYSSEELKADFIQARTHRWPLLRLLLKHIPEDRVKYGRRVVDIITNSDGAKLIFEDGHAWAHFDLIAAADGIYSGIRSKYFPDHTVQFKGAVAYRTIFPKSQLREIKGLHDDSSAWRKDGEVVFLSELGLDQYGVVIIRREAPEYASSLQWQHSVGLSGLQRLRELYKAWDPIILEVLNVIEDIEAYPLDSGPWLKELSKEGLVAFLGDAAHPTAGAFGAGAAMGFGDCWALKRALEASRDHFGGTDGGYNVSKALSLFQATRLPFLSRVEKQMEIDTQNAIYIAEASQDEPEWIRRFKERNPLSQWLTEHDVELEVQKVITGEHQ